MTTASKVALILVIVGALNWLTVGLFHLDLVAAVFGANSVLTRSIYVIVGLAGLGCIPLLFGRRLGPSIAAEETNARLRKAA